MNINLHGGVYAVGADFIKRKEWLKSNLDLKAGQSIEVTGIDFEPCVITLKIVAGGQVFLHTRYEGIQDRATNQFGDVLDVYITAIGHDSFVVTNNTDLNVSIEWTALG